LDPHNKYLPPSSKPGIRLRFSALADQFPDQFAPFVQFMPKDRPFSGTLFRFPLRTASTAAASEIKSQPYALEDMRQLIAALAAHAHELLLFLKNVTTIHLWTQTDAPPATVARITASPHEDVLPQRQLASMRAYMRDDKGMALGKKRCAVLTIFISNLR
jgi:hypothetical protein